MPKKTKKEKLLAQRHRKNLTPVVFESTPQPAGDPSPFQFTLSNKPVSAPSPHARETVENFAAIQHDLTKTLVITIGIIISELLLARYLPQ